MRTPAIIFVLVLASILAAASGVTNTTSSLQPTGLQPNTLCAKDERVIFSCPVRRPAKIVSICASKNLTADQGYLQYRFGLPGRVELEYPKDRKGTQEKFQYTHYFRARFDITTINFSVDGNDYSVHDDYNGEEKPERVSRGVIVTPSGKTREVSLDCRTKPKADYSDLQAVLPEGRE